MTWLLLWIWMMKKKMPRIAKLARYFDLRMGLVGAGFMALVVLFVNIHHGFIAALPAMLKQGLYTFLAGGFMMRMTENLALSTGKKSAYLLSVGIPSLIAVSLTYLLHSLKGTPEPLWSTVPTLLLGPPGFWWWSYRKRRGIANVPSSQGHNNQDSQQIKQ